MSASISTGAEGFEIPKALFDALNSEYGAIRQGAAKSVLDLLAQKTKLSKSDIRMMCKEKTPATTVIQSSGTKAKVTKSRDGPKTMAIKADTSNYPLDQRVAGSEYQTAIKAARAADKADKSTEESRKRPRPDDISINPEKVD